MRLTVRMAYEIALLLHTAPLKVNLSRRRRLGTMAWRVVE